MVLTVDVNSARDVPPSDAGNPPSRVVRRPDTLVSSAAVVLASRMVATTTTAVATRIATGNKARDVMLDQRFPA
jgi:hypothetical protein